ncbi:DNA mismatch repair endonuclease MutL [Methanocorpusculum vombati]|uniref:DNA mismatch repair protein MutL n=1 Tax=Methanocorpusculum vombati TaxID=3002864 RepID=A0ABT4IKD8_9EURY|nr:DNA mismatch repair endonuclease MutL [Methanocorpusculum vombati]MCZ9320119.1 DNA mismatch repair endonuclease MutL [Methanocorpusculum sp.]MCZ0862202.1 DNA mismatch repair endonuclease MutL [Methanocorpusculum vombati]MDE2519680.1 DNA mismatch repair endonuclease MutL [Methanocorpusculum sp.]MDE2533469.1 DNA mismatch repair endonuclease MutL [Methanocorpusculum sp.]MDE2545242.1 DNA mismatch repair endonuclease MutL [Methanocorpusculum sp.]
MGVITVLDEETISHIAAGEVVERAASVVKELVENAIDAGANRIRIDLAADKTAVTRIAVTDDGCGMEHEDALLAFRQHATSKISRPEDLAAIGTLGFRGEAMASIAAVSQVTLTTKRRGSERPEATRVVIHGGELVEHAATGAPEGTSVVVEGLFYNTPARRKFQKTVATELAHIYDMVERLTLAHREISFVLSYQGKERFRTYGNGNFTDVIAAVFGQTFARDLVPVAGTYGIVKVAGFVTRPGCEMKSTPSRFYLSINRRQVTSRPLQWAVREGYGTLLPKGMYPAAFLDLEINPADVDVNVHPTKKEVRLSRERDVQTGVQDAVYCALHETRVFAAAAGTEIPEPPRDAGGSGSAGTAATAAMLPLSVLGEAASPYERRISPQMKDPVSPKVPAAAALRQTDKQLRRTESFEPPETTEFVPEVLGQIADTYILARNETGDLVVVDQHAAHERVMYDLLLARQERGLAGQELIVPVQLKLTKKEAAAVPDLLPVLADAGYTLEPFGKDIWMVRTVPVVSSSLGDPAVIHEIIARALDKSSSGGEESVLDRVLKTAACRSVVKGATPMTTEQMQRLLRQLMATRSPYTCPHGRPTTIVLTKDRLAAMFLRT